MTGCSIGNNLTSVLLGVTTTIGDMIIKIGVSTDDGATSLRANSREFRPLLHLDAPTLIVGQVPMEHIHIMQCQQIDELLDEFNREEMARAVKMHATPREARRIGNNGCRQLKHLKQGL